MYTLYSFPLLSFSRQISTSAVDSLPTLVAGGTARFELSNQNEQMADQAGEEVIEDEFSLDDIMGEDVGGGEFLSREQILRQDEEQGEERGDKVRFSLFFFLENTHVIHLESAPLSVCEYLSLSMLCLAWLYFAET